MKTALIDEYITKLNKRDKEIVELKDLLKVMDEAKHAALQREGFAVEERDKARELFQTAMELSKKYKINHVRYCVNYP